MLVRDPKANSDDELDPQGGPYVVRRRVERSVQAETMRWFCHAVVVQIVEHHVCIEPLCICITSEVHRITWGKQAPISSQLRNPRLFYSLNWLFPMSFSPQRNIGMLSACITASALCPNLQIPSLIWSISLILTPLRNPLCDGMSFLYRYVGGRYKAGTPGHCVLIKLFEERWEISIIKDSKVLSIPDHLTQSLPMPH